MRICIDSFFVDLSYRYIEFAKFEIRCHEIDRARVIFKYGIDNVKRQYSDSRYPFACDFYIPSEDLFIEFNRNWTHGGHPFDESNLDDIYKFEQWQEKAETSNYYKNAIYTWTDLDVRKQKCAKENNLNYKMIY